MKKQEILVQEDDCLLEYLRKYGIAKNKTKTFVKLGFLKINGTTISKLPVLVKKGDKIVINNSLYQNKDFQIIYEDTNYLIVEKTAGLLTISTSNQNKKTEHTLYRMVREYLNQKKEHAFIVNRIDKETSGLVVFVKNEELKNQLQNNWNKIVKKRGYIAIVAGKITKPGTINNYLYEDKNTFSHSTKVGGKQAITNYKPIKTNKLYTMLDVDIETGRKNQIRVHMTEMNHPIIGDKKYYSKDNPLKRLALHHYQIAFIDPLTNQLLTFTSKVPKEFYDLFH